MKKTIFTLLTAMTSLAFANEPLPTAPSYSELKLDYPDLKPAENPLSEETKSLKQGFFYVRFTAANKDLSYDYNVVPGLGVGYRRLAGNGAADISFNGIGRAERRSGQLFWTAPKASYIHYLQPNAKKTAYLGGGLAWGGVDKKEHHFIGIIPNILLGYEFMHKEDCLGFTELNISQPAVSVYHTGAFPGPIAEISAGIGF